MPLSLPVSSSHHTVSVSLSLFHLAHTKNTCTKEKVIVSAFTRAPSFLPLWPPPFLSRRFRCFFFLVLLCRTPCFPVDPCPLPSSHCTNTADRRWTRCHDTVACRPTNPPQSARQQAWVCVFDTQFWSVCEHQFIVLGLHLYICGCVRHAEHGLCSDFSLSFLPIMLVFILWIGRIGWWLRPKWETESRRLT